MSILKIDVALILLIVLSVGVAVIQGRGGRVEEERRFLERAAPSVEDFPIHLGKWRMVEDEPLTERTLAILQCQNHVNRTYVHDDSGQRVMLTLLLGPAGPLVAHSPEVCLPSTQYDLLFSSEGAEVATDDGKELTVSRAVFRSKDLGQHIMRIYYAWVRPDGSWVAPPNPRWTLGGDLGLFKLQLATVLSGAEIAKGDYGEVGNSAEDGTEDEANPPLEDSVERFLREHGTELQELLAGYLVSSPVKAGGSRE